MLNSIKMLMVATLIWAAFYTNNGIIPTLSGNYAGYECGGMILSLALGAIALMITLAGLLALMSAISTRGQYVPMRRWK